MYSVKAAVKIVGGLLAVSVGALAVLSTERLWASRPTLDAQLTLEGLHAPLRVDRDRDGVPTIVAVGRDDAAYGLGFAHAQERFFQMDVSRRAGAGRLAELFGEEALVFDRMLRIHGCQ